MKPRINMVMFDRAKGLAMLSVILIHSGTLAEEDPYGIVLLRSALTAVFFMASGFFLRKRKLGKGIKMAARDLLVPYALTMVVIWAVGLAHRLLIGDLDNFLSLFFLPVLRRGAGPRSGALWFLLTMFWGWNLFYLVLMLPNEKWQWIAVAVGSVVGTLALPLHDYTYLLPQSLMILPFIYGGYFIRVKRLFEREVNPVLLLAMCVPAVVIGFFGKLDLIMDTADLGILNVAAQGLFGYAIIYGTLLSNECQFRALEWIDSVGRYSLWVFCVHSVEMSVVPYDFLWRYVDISSPLGVIAQLVVRGAIIFLGCVALRKAHQWWGRYVRARKEKKGRIFV